MGNLLEAFCQTWGLSGLDRTLVAGMAAGQIFSALLLAGAQWRKPSLVWRFLVHGRKFLLPLGVQALRRAAFGMYAYLISVRGGTWGT